MLEITLTVGAAYLCFWVAEDILGVSGVLAVVTLAIWMAGIGKYAISPEVSVCHHPRRTMYNHGLRLMQLLSSFELFLKGFCCDEDAVLQCWEHTFPFPPGLLCA